ncbi:hypothetical protein [Pseudomonas baetica]|uniref:hypothetical protein n=1 Tax=Pseudomonas baetica TaxID=674054 RepID=UPI0024076CAF|nr:hypothetical protein [Pseudomonas baetica]MDF9778775.1 hypothetical protein [Pseudomonas baetica]
MQKAAAPSKSIDDLVTLSFAEHQKLELTRQRPIGVLSGRTGTGKVEALQSAVLPFLAAGGCVLRITHSRDTNDALLDFVQANKRSHRGRYATYVVELEYPDIRPTLAQVLERFTPPEGTLVIIEEPQALKDMSSSALFGVCDRLNVAMVLLVQDMAILGDFNESRTAFAAQMTGQRSITVLGASGQGETVVELSHPSSAATAIRQRSLFSAAMGSKWVWGLFAVEAILMFGMAIFNGNGTLVLFALLFAIGAGYLPWQFEFAAESSFVKIVMSKKGRWWICTVCAASALLLITGNDQKRLVALFIVILFMMIPFKVIQRSAAR